MSGYGWVAHSRRVLGYVGMRGECSQLYNCIRISNCICICTDYQWSPFSPANSSHQQVSRRWFCKRASLEIAHTTSTGASTWHRVQRGQGHLLCSTCVLYAMVETHTYTVHMHDIHSYLDSGSSAWNKRAGAIRARREKPEVVSKHGELCGNVRGWLVGRERAGRNYGDW
jgi:hypothetical protein